MKKLIFVSDKIHLKSDIPGGVQICTKEYIKLLESADFEVIPFPVNHTRNIFTRFKIKMGIELYSRYDKFIVDTLIEKVKAEKAKYIAFNQVDFLKIAKVLRKRLGKSIKIIALSHGNESGDFLHSIVRSDKRRGIKHLRDIIRLGFAIYRESASFIYDFDVVLSISQTEQQINNWLGAKKSIFIPRTFNPDYIDWKPNLSRLGFVGTLNHKPNIDGLLALIKEFEKQKITDYHIRVVGGPISVGKKLAEKHKIIDYVGHLSDEELRAEAESWAFFLNPILWYSRGASTKLAQGINWGIPIISTPAGNRGYELPEGRIYTVENVKQMVDHIIKQTQSVEKLEKIQQSVKFVAENGKRIEEMGKELKEVL